jgi:hypothetical protein
MVAYCTDTSRCRRQTFSDAFGTPEAALSSPHVTASSSSRRQSFERCGSMCDNCLESRSREGRGGSHRTGGETAPSRHIFRSESAPLAVSQWTQKKTEKRRPSTSFTTASGKKIQPSIIHLEEEEERRGTAHRGHKRRRMSDEEEEEIEMRAGAGAGTRAGEGGDAASDSDDEEDRKTPAHSTVGTNRQSAGLRGQKLFQSAKEALRETTKIFVSNQTPRGIEPRPKPSSSHRHGEEVHFIE